MFLESETLIFQSSPPSGLQRSWMILLYNVVVYPVSLLISPTKFHVHLLRSKLKFAWWYYTLWLISCPFSYVFFYTFLSYLYSYDWSGQMYVTGSNDGHVFVCDARVSNNFKVVGHLGTYHNGFSFLCLLKLEQCRTLFLFFRNSFSLWLLTWDL